ncbi:MAG: hypothetical protein ACOC1O_00360 [bacterium]
MSSKGKVYHFPKKDDNIIKFLEDKSLKFERNSFKENDEVIITELKSNRKIFITYEKNDFHFSFNGNDEGSKNTKVYEYLKKFVLNKLKNIIIEYFSGYPIEVFAFIGKDGFFIYDINVNSKFIEYQLLEEILNKMNFKKFPVIFEGEFKDIPKELPKCIVRLKYEDPTSKRLLTMKLH